MATLTAGSVSLPLRVTRKSVVNVKRAKPSARLCRPQASLTLAATADPSTSTDLVLVDHYARLGISRGASNAEIAKAFEVRCKEVTENLKLDEEQARQQVQALEASLDVLTSDEQRRLYDWAVARAQGDAADGGAAPYVWPFEADLTQKYTQTDLGKPPRPMVADDAEGTNQLGLVFLAWLALSVVLSLTLY